MKVNGRIKEIIVIAIACGLLVVGVFGLVLPIIPGLVFLGFGLMLLSLYFPKVRLWIDARAKPYPKLYASVQKAEKWLEEALGKF